MSAPDGGRATLTAEYFEHVYAENDDPWSFATSAYEAEKYRASLAVLGERAGHALEIGCSIGVFTAMLAGRCDDLLAVDINAHALELAEERCRDLPQVRFDQRDVTRAWPPGEFDLITVCEVAYYWSDADLTHAIDCMAQSLRTGGNMLLVHFLPVVDDYVRTGDAVHEWFLRDERFERVTGSRAERYRIDLLRRR